MNTEGNQIYPFHISLHVQIVAEDIHINPD